MKDLDLLYLVQATGLAEGTPEYERELRLIKITRCQQFQGVESCFPCRAYLDCSVAKDHLREEREYAIEAGRRAGAREAMLARDIQEMVEELEETNGNDDN